MLKPAACAKCTKWAVLLSRPVDIQKHILNVILF